MPDIYMDTDIALSEVPVNVMPLLSDTDFKTRQTAIVYNSAGMDLVWNFVTTGGVFSQTAVTPTTAGAYDWVHQGDGMYTIEIPASGGASINNDTEGFGWFTGLVTGVLPWRGPVIGFRAAAINNSLIDGTGVEVRLSSTGVNDILRTALTEGYAADGAAPTLEQFMFMLLSALGEFSISGTTITCKKLDGTTTSMTYTLNDATNPTSRTRAT